MKSRKPQKDDLDESADASSPERETRKRSILRRPWIVIGFLNCVILIAGQLATIICCYMLFQTHDRVGSVEAKLADLTQAVENTSREDGALMSALKTPAKVEIDENDQSKMADAFTQAIEKKLGTALREQRQVIQESSRTLAALNAKIDQESKVRAEADKLAKAAAENRINTAMKKVAEDDHALQTNLATKLSDLGKRIPKNMTSHDVFLAMANSKNADAKTYYRTVRDLLVNEPFRDTHPRHRVAAFAVEDKIKNIWTFNQYTKGQLKPSPPETGNLVIWDELNTMLVTSPLSKSDKTVIMLAESSIDPPKIDEGNELPARIHAVIFHQIKKQGAAYPDTKRDLWFNFTSRHQGTLRVQRYIVTQSENGPTYQWLPSSYVSNPPAEDWQSEGEYELKYAIQGLWNPKE